VRLLYTRPGAFVANLLGRPRARRIVRWLGDVVPTRSSILDVGCGLGHIAEALRASGHEVTTVDPRYRPLCGGSHLASSATSIPVASRSFDIVLLAFVLHHMPANAHSAALGEAARVARRRVILLEDTFRSSREKRWTFAVDSLINAEFRGHPHSNRTAAEWTEQLAAQGLAPLLEWERRERWLGMPIRHALITGEVRLTRPAPVH
jgi:ubiquinone/menaquinone biosynthesis C-methylase UbiE